VLLTDRKIRETVPDSKDIKLSDGDGLYLLVRPNSARWWRMRFSVHGVEKQLSLGVYPLISLKRARERREDLRRQVAEGIDHSAVRKAEKSAQAQTFEAVAREWMAKRKAIWSSEYANNMTRRFEQHVFPWLGSKLIKSLTAADPLCRDATPADWGSGRGCPS
jgi:hypothetical protein